MWVSVTSLRTSVRLATSHGSSISHVTSLVSRILSIMEVVSLERQQEIVGAKKTGKEKRALTDGPPLPSAPLVCGKVGQLRKSPDRLISRLVRGESLGRMFRNVRAVRVVRGARPYVR
jgi:hypothetical protein